MAMELISIPPIQLEWTEWIEWNKLKALALT